MYTMYMYFEFCALNQLQNVHVGLKIDLHVSKKFNQFEIQRNNDYNILMFVTCQQLLS